MADDPRAAPPPPTLPAWARLPINRCNLPPEILGGLSFQENPSPLRLDGVFPFHAALFAMLDALPDAAARAERFRDYMTVHFCLETPEDAGGTPNRHRTRADYARILRGWFFDADGREAAVIKGWVESRFGLAARFHKGRLHAGDAAADARFAAERARGVYGTHALDAQLDLLYAFVQSELARRPETHLTLYRGVNGLAEFDVLERTSKREATVVLNAMNSFTRDPDRASEFGDSVLEARLPREKVFCAQDLLPGQLTGENEVMVIGGACRVRLRT
ncbi:NAD(+)--dinitrogen-reductase ADP-D-ribosyltransferase [uncultured Alphaproteobacteria bacterium]|uniref:NAD(+)--dinitrogen-reductase ADP-D-ribosyltransferase n=1 Tax=uncultured Alphaproteobacteria bacterium TaxID=91750 RepID=A0A212K5A3_9PROT|nr:NAD(+)--dinitrogen-reductase ADP-D-ribosyltransferase [uncultured Alphaproteobacteria bacterium]